VIERSLFAVFTTFESEKPEPTSSKMSKKSFIGSIALNGVGSPRNINCYYYYNNAKMMNIVLTQRSSICRSMAVGCEVDTWMHYYFNVATKKAI
jgi:hypothetical protein